ncbi:MAG: nitroreductase family protein [Leptothrix sp. (in: b-proteobacteria)]
MSSTPSLTDLRFDDAGADVGEAVAAHPLLGALLARRTVRRYTDAVPDEALLGAIEAAALCASSKSDFQQASILRVREAAIRSALGALFPAMPWIGAAPVFYVFLADARRLERIGTLRGKAVDNGTLEGFFNATVDAALVLQTFVLAAESAGLGCCPISVIRNRIEVVAPLLGLPDQVFPVAGLCVGEPADASHLSLRLPRRVTLHTDQHDDGALAEAIEAYDQRRHARHAIAPAQQRSPARFGEAAFYGWSEDKARQAAEPEGAAFGPWLRAHGFTL